MRAALESFVREQRMNHREAHEGKKFEDLWGAWDRLINRQVLYTYRSLRVLLTPGGER